MRDKKVTFIVQAAVIAALYVVLTFVANALGLASHTIQVCTYLLRNHKIACTFPPVIFNMIIVPFVLVYAYGIPAVYFHGVNVTIPFNAITVGIGEVISVCVLGSILMRVLAKYRNVMFRATAQ